MNSISKEDIIYQDDYIVILNKPSGMLTHPSWIDKDNAINAMAELRDYLGQWVYTVHRLDRPTSGVLIFGLSSEIANKLANAFASRETEKTYLALARGYTEEYGLINHPLKDLWDKMTDKEKSIDSPAREAITEYWRLAITELNIPVRPHPTSRYSLVKVIPHTGRSRQIRRHFKHIFHHLIGDHQHGDGFHNRMLSENFGLNRLMLHAWKLKITHPITGKQITFEAPIPEDFKNLLQKIGINPFSIKT